MMLWLILALMMAAALVAVVWPLARGRGMTPRAATSRSIATSSRRSSATAPMRASTPADAEAARVEVSRRLIAAANAANARPATPVTAPTSSPPQRPSSFADPAARRALYLRLVHRTLPGQPLAARIQGGRNRGSNRSPVDRARRSASRAESGRRPRLGGHRAGLYAARTLRRCGARRNAILDCSARRPRREADLGEALIAAANGVVTDGGKGRVRTRRDARRRRIARRSSISALRPSRTATPPRRRGSGAR